MAASHLCVWHQCILGRSHKLWIEQSLPKWTNFPAHLLEWTMLVHLQIAVKARNFRDELLQSFLDVASTTLMHFEWSWYPVQRLYYPDMIGSFSQTIPSTREPIWSEYGAQTLSLICTMEEGKKDKLSLKITLNFIDDTMHHYIISSVTRWSVLKTMHIR